VLAQALVQIERRQHGASRMILLGYGRAKDGREALTRQRRERAFVGLQHLLGHPNAYLEQVIQPLWAPLRRQRWHVGEGTAEDAD
jgi:hypothetical protein